VIDPRALNDFEAIEWEGALVHHSATGPTVSAKSIADYHVRERGWRAVGYHGLIELGPKGWRFVEGRSLSLPGSHCPGVNKTHLGLCLIGNFSHATPPSAQLDAAAGVLAEWCVSFNFSPAEIFPHRQFRKTECPGLVDILGLRARVAALLAHG
jgi:hypothetical protein